MGEIIISHVFNEIKTVLPKTNKNSNIDFSENFRLNV
jgi:hypothetical protein